MHNRVYPIGTCEIERKRTGKMADSDQPYSSVLAICYVVSCPIYVTYLVISPDLRCSDREILSYSGEFDFYVYFLIHR